MNLFSSIFIISNILLFLLYYNDYKKLLFLLINFLLQITLFFVKIYTKKEKYILIVFVFLYLLYILKINILFFIPVIIINVIFLYRTWFSQLKNIIINDKKFSEYLFYSEKITSCHSLILFFKRLPLKEYAEFIFVCFGAIITYHFFGLYSAEYFLIILLLAELEIVFEKNFLNFDREYSKYIFFKTTIRPYKNWFLNSYELKIGIIFTVIIFLFLFFIVFSEGLNFYILLFFINLLLLMVYIVKSYIFVYYKSLENKRKINHYFLFAFIIFVAIIFQVPDMYSKIFFKIQGYRKIYGEFFKITFLMILNIFNIHKLISDYIFKKR
ncbi:hypothetical protein XO10_02760 [Marinitoga sp. 1135]|nr:hypothetical protein LN42_03075 [Marinitoga sp. 1137]NUU95210.1 hypothetical protein [Marinitoga sp. 1135]NUU97143.1 hypothetical protein [Marinitoga sp. 1138]